jgi:aminopeptidase N
MKYAIFSIFCFTFISSVLAQQPYVPTFTRADTLRGALRPERTCYKLNYEHLDVRIDPEKKFLTGVNHIRFNVDSSFDRMQIDLFQNMEIDSIVLDGKTPTKYMREFNAVFVQLPQKLEKGTLHEIGFWYSGFPQIAKRPPWDGGFTWRKDSVGNPWVCVTCQGTGASLWWPNKDHQSDEPDSMTISVTVPQGLEDVSNGRLRGVADLHNGWTRYDWFVSVPINNYDVTVNIGKFAHFADTYVGITGDTLTLDYYVLPQNVDMAKKQFTDVKRMLTAYERYFGPYPFYKDGYKLIESPHNGMEHQSAIAYGNRYTQGYRGRATSEVGLKFDFIIVHESAHEWWGNSITSKDVADMWIHESFGAYAEALFVEYWYGREQSLAYINGKKWNVRGDSPIIGTYNVQNEGSGDMYDKGQLVLNTLRSVIDNDSLWFSILRGFQKTYKYQTVTAETVFQYVNAKTGKDFTYFFDQYLKHTKIPDLNLFVTKKRDKVTLRYKWTADVPDFNMPVKVTTSEGKYDWIYPTSTWQTMTLGDIVPAHFKVAEDLFFVNPKIAISYIDPHLPDN